MRDCGGPARAGRAVGVNQIALAHFERTLTNFAKTLPTELLVPFHKRISLDALARVVAKTPVDTGRARLNWQLTIATPAQGSLLGADVFKVPAPAAPISAESSTAFANGSAAISGLQPFAIVWLSNNLPYIQRLEDGWSKKQAPGGMLGLTIQELQAQFA